MKHTSYFLVLLILILSPCPAFAKRVAPASIEPITTKWGTIHHRFVRNSQGFSVYIISKDKAGDLRWKTKLFSKRYNKDLETDVQDIHLKKLVVKDTDIIAVDERGRKYRIDIFDGSIQNNLKP